MPEASSDFATAAGSTTEAASKKANQIPGPMISAAKVGVTKIPGSMADKEMMITPDKPMLRASSFFPLSAVDAGVDAMVHSLPKTDRTRAVIDYKTEDSYMGFV